MARTLTGGLQPSNFVPDKIVRIHGIKALHFLVLILLILRNPVN